MLKDAPPSVKLIPCDLEAGIEYTITKPSETYPESVHLVAHGDPFVAVERDLAAATE
jgi:hypothetical protein